ncbi:hypothetical protein D3C76_1865940 [compost metagenome]
MICPLFDLNIGPALCDRPAPPARDPWDDWECRYLHIAFSHGIGFVIIPDQLDDITVVRRW